MGLRYWPLALALLVGFAVLGYWWWRHRPAPAEGSLLVANTDALRRAPAFRQQARRLLRWSTVQVLSLGMMVVGGWLLAGRLGSSDESPSVQHNRDIMLCLDISGSMRNVDTQLLKGFSEIARGLRGERVGLTIWNSSAVVKFPLTSDYDFIAEQLRDGAEKMEKLSSSFTSGANEGSGSSLIGDGIVSCLQRFDRLDTERARTLVLATDNDLAGDPLFTIEEAFALLKEQKVVTFTISPYDDAEYVQLRRLAEDGGGAGYLLGSNQAGREIVRSIQSREASRLQGEKQLVLQDLSALGLSLLTVGLVGWLVASRKVV